MKVLLIHSYYLQRGGEDNLFEQEFALLNRTEDVRTLSFRNKPGYRGALQFLFSIWNLAAARRLKNEIRSYRPDVIHLHNIHFAIGPLAIRVAKQAGVPVVMTLHNYRLLCPSATLSYKGELFTESLNETFPWKAVRKKVYRDSLLQTFWLAWIIFFHKKIGTWKMIDRYIVLTDFARELFLHSSFGLKPEKYVVKSNFKDEANLSSVQKGKHFLFVGRLSPEKGIRVLLDAFAGSDLELQIAGDGPLLPEVMSATEKYANIRFLGPLDHKKVQDAMQECTSLVFPSIWYEGMPMTILEAFSTGTPVIAGKLGAMASLIEHGYNGLHYNADDPRSLSEKLLSWQNMDTGRREKIRQNALSTYKAHYTPEQNKKTLLDIYNNTVYAKGIDKY